MFRMYSLQTDVVCIETILDEFMLQCDDTIVFILIFLSLTCVHTFLSPYFVLRKSLYLSLIGHFVDCFFMLEYESKLPAAVLVWTFSVSSYDQP